MPFTSKAAVKPEHQTRSLIQQQRCTEYPLHGGVFMCFGWSADPTGWSLAEPTLGKSELRYPIKPNRMQGIWLNRDPISSLRCRHT